MQTDFHGKPTTKLLWVAFGLGCCCFAWLWGYDKIFLLAETFTKAEGMMYHGDMCVHGGKLTAYVEHTLDGVEKKGK